MLKDRYNMVKIKIREYLNPYLSHHRCRKLRSNDFSIISNNCWAGHVYRYFGLPYATPTIGLYFWAEDYLTLLSDIKGFLGEELYFIEPEASKHYDMLSVRQEEHVPIGCLEHEGKRIEIIFLHYQSKEEAKEKWQRRVKRINYDHLIVKNSYQNGCTDEMVKRFEKINDTTRFMFVPQKNMRSRYCVYYKGWDNSKEVGNDVNDFLSYLDIYELINHGAVVQKGCR